MKYLSLPLVMWKHTSLWGTHWLASWADKRVHFQRSSFSLAWLPVKPFASSKDPERCRSFITDLLPDILTWSCVLQVMILVVFSLIKPRQRLTPIQWLSVFADSAISAASTEMDQSYLLTGIACSVFYARFSFVELIREALPQFGTISHRQFKITHIIREFPFSFLSQGDFFFLLLST